MLPVLYTVGYPLLLFTAWCWGSEVLWSHHFGPADSVGTSAVDRIICKPGFLLWFSNCRVRGGFSIECAGDGRLCSNKSVSIADLMMKFYKIAAAFYLLSAPKLTVFPWKQALSLVRCFGSGFGSNTVRKALLGNTVTVLSKNLGMLEVFKMEAGALGDKWQIQRCSVITGCCQIGTEMLPCLGCTF